MFQPTHLLISRTRQTPVMLVPGKKGMSIFTEQEWQQQVAEPAFEFRPKQGFFCKNVLIIGYNLQPMQLEVQPSEQAPTQAPITSIN
jgi:hypothetical protein